jgi:23S rRNA (guanosine2251-2'-O)-methyltransferase
MASHKSERRRGKAQANGNPKFWGRHAVLAAIANPERVIHKIWATRDTLNQLNLPDGLPVQFAEVTDLARFVPKDAPHQGIVAEVAPLEDLWLADVLPHDQSDIRPLLILDQVTDPHNVGAIFRSAAAFGAVAIVTQDRHAPAETGVLAKAASGALELVPWIRVVNLARTLEEVGEAGYWRIALDGEGSVNLAEALVPGRNALILGAEGDGIRRNVMEHCDQIARLPIDEAMESLNVSNAAAISLYAAATRETE